ncbi:MAG: DUF922 domain-containing protein [Negativicutes bacterium]|nr:DUF922 domain-containing protein [Negativicutes bacterium]
MDRVRDAALLILLFKTSKLSKNNGIEITDSMFSKKSEYKDGQLDKKVSSKLTCFSIGCSIPLIFAVAFFVWIFASLDQPNLDEKNITTAPSATPTQSDAKTETKESTVKSPPRVTNNCDGNFIPPKSSALKINTNNPGFKKDIDIHYYRVYGNVADDIIAGINKCGPTENGEHYAAFTRYQTHWVFMKYPASSGCRVQDVAVGTKIDLYYPKWEPTKDAEAGLAEKWQVYFDLVEDHENKHKQNALNAGKEILKYLNSLSNVPCELINSGAESILDSQKIKDEELEAIDYPKAKKWLK